MSRFCIATFEVAGEPVPQGSMKIMPITRIPDGGLLIRSPKELLSKVTMTSDNKKLKPWRDSIEAQAQVSMRGREAYADGPVKVVALFAFPYRQGDLQASGEAKAIAPFWKSTQPDLDKLQRALGDALTGVVFKDDGQVSWWDVQKTYSHEPRVEVYVYGL